jgi:uncharacterized membrane protein YfcA
MKYIIELWRENSIIQGLIALGATGTAGYMYIIGKDVPESLIGIVGLIVGYYFGSKTAQTTKAIVNGLRRKDE